MKDLLFMNKITEVKDYEQNILFKVLDRSYSLNVHSGVVFRFIQKDSFTMSEPWFDHQITLSINDREILTKRLRGIINQYD